MTDNSKSIVLHNITLQGYIAGIGGGKDKWFPNEAEVDNTEFASCWAKDISKEISRMREKVCILGSSLSVLGLVIIKKV